MCCWVADRFTATATATACQQFLGFGIVIMLIMQAHACPWRHTDNTANVINHVICFLNQGFMSDNSLACAMRRFPNHFFMMEPAFMIQNADVASNLQLVSSKGGRAGYDRAHRLLKQGKRAVGAAAKKMLSPQIRKLLGKDLRGTAPISQSSRQQLRPRITKLGGSQHAGKRSDVKTVQKKVNAMKSYRKHGTFPTRAYSNQQWGVSNKLWERARGEVTSG